MANLESTNLLNLLGSKKFNQRLGKLGNNTYARVDTADPGKHYASVYLHGNRIALMYYMHTDYVLPTAIAMKHPSITKILKISDCGWGTVTTRDRLNQILSDNKVPYYVHQKKHEQILSPRNEFENTTNYWENRRSGYSVVHEAAFAYDALMEMWIQVPAYI